MGYNYGLMDDRQKLKDVFRAMDTNFILNFAAELAAERIANIDSTDYAKLKWRDITIKNFKAELTEQLDQRI